jgi:hypothetical protein
LTFQLPCNPALPLLALLTAGVPLLLLAWRRPGGATASRQAWRDLAIAWAALGLAGMGLLAPALALPTGIPSPAGTLAAAPPWQGAPETREARGERWPGNPLLRDVTYQIQPWLLFGRRELRAGRLPVWNPHQSAGSPFWGNGQSAPLFPLHLLFAALPLQLGFMLLPWLRLVIAGCGVWMLARELGLGLQAALLAAVSFALSGMLVSFALFPMGNALALVPWVWWAVERLAAAESQRGWRLGAAGLAAASGLQLLGGHPETAAHSALLSLLYLAVRGARRPAAAWAGWAAGWLGGAALAAVHLLPLAFILPETTRWQAPAGGAEPPFALLLQQPLRLLLPELYGHPALGTWWGPFNYSATAVYAGALALPLAAAGLARCRRDRRWVALAAVTAFAFVAAYHWPGVRDLLRALPVLGRAAQHRLLFGVELGVALLAGAGFDEWLAGRGRGLLAGGAAALALLAAGWALHRAAWAAHGLLGTEAAWTAVAAAAALLLALSLRLDRGWRRRLAPLLPALALCDLLVAHGAINPALPLERLYPATGAVRFLATRPGRVTGVGEALRPNAATAYGLYDPRGDDPVKLARYEAVYQSLGAADSVYFQPVTQWSSPWLDRLGVRWVVAGPEEAAPADGWRLAYAADDARVYERSTALPLVRWAAPAAAGGRAAAEPAAGLTAGPAGAAATAGLAVVGHEPGRWEIAWRSAEPRLLEVAETWEQGWRASTGGGSRLPVEAAGGALLGVRLGPGAGRVELRYRPRGLAAGAAISLAALLGLAGLAAMAAMAAPGAEVGRAPHRGSPQAAGALAPASAGVRALPSIERPAGSGGPEAA